MATQTAAAAGLQLPDRQVTEREARFLPGLRMLVLGIVLILAGVILIVVASHQSHGVAAALIVLCILIFIGSSLVLGVSPRSSPGGPASSSCSAATGAPSATRACSG